MKKRLMMFLACLFLSLGMAMAQTQVTGVVTSSEDGLPVIGASIKVLGTNTGTVTDVDGAFSLSVPEGAKLQVSYIGMNAKTVIAKKSQKIVLTPDNKTLDDVVVVAYGTAKRSSLTGSVSVVGEDKIKKSLSTTATAALEGAAPGIQVNSSYGEPGSNPEIRIRGIGTLVKGAEEPLYVVDGVPFEGNISEINPNDIDNMSILKDASSSALYGSRAANGVVIITTKKGQNNGKASVTLNINQGVYTRGMSEYDRLGANQWMETSWQAMKNFAMSGSLVENATDAAAYATEHLVSDYAQRNIYDGADDKLFDANGKLTAKMKSGYNDLDWFDNIERTGWRQEYNMSVSAGNDKFNVYSSAGYLNEKGYIKNIGFERFSGLVKADYKPTTWFKTGVKLTSTYYNQRFNDGAKGSAYANPFNVARYMAPIYPIYMHNADGSYALDLAGNKQYDTTSPYLSNRNISYEMDMDTDKNHRAVIGANIFGTALLPYGFSFTLTGDLNHINNNRQSYNNPVIGDGSTNNGRLASYAYQYNYYTLQELLNWTMDYGVHHIDATLGHENHSWMSSYTYALNTDMVAQGNMTMGNFVKNSSSIGSDDTYKTEGYFFRARYNYDEKYFADFSYRRDGSSRFSKDARWGNFFSFGLNWNAKGESFLRDVKWLNTLRARASYGEVGNDKAASYYAYQSLYYIDKNGNSETGALIRQSLPANNLKWETTQTVDLGVQGRLFNCLNFELGYFDKRSKDLLFQVRLPYSAGSFPYVSDGDPSNLTVWKNIGTISNRGFEFSADVDVIRKNNLTWNVFFNGTTLSSKLKKLPDGKDILNGLMKFSQGHDPYEYFTYHFEGVDQMTGNSLYTLDPDSKAKAVSGGALVTINGTDYTTKTSYAKKQWTGSAIPNLYGSFGTNLSWKSFSFSMMLSYSMGGKIYDSSYKALMSTASASSASALHKDLLKSWTSVPEGMTETSGNRIDTKGIPVLDFNRSTDNNDTSDRWLTSASYLIFKNVTLGYTLPRNIVSGWGLSGVTLNAGIENLFTMTKRKGLNPQQSFTGNMDDTYVPARVFNFGLTVNF